jgi:hypothetical protein
MHETGQTSTQLAFFSPMHGSTMTYVMQDHLLALALCRSLRAPSATQVTFGGSQRKVDDVVVDGTRLSTPR